MTPPLGRWRSPVARMKAVAGLLLLAAALLHGVATAMLRHPAPSASPWSLTAWGYLAAFAEAAMVGAIADWFAVTALFRRPLGLPIPHTAIVPRGKARIGRTLSTFITTHFLATPLVLARLRALDPGRRLADWLRHPRNAEAVGHQSIGVARVAVDLLDDERVRAFVRRQAARRLEALEAAPLLGGLLQALTREGRHQAMFDELLIKLDELLRDDDIRALVARAIATEIRTLRYLGLDKRVGDWSASKVVDGLSALIGEVAATPDHPLRLRFDTLVEGYIERLNHDPAYRRRGARLVARALAHPATGACFQGLWDDLLGWLRDDLSRDDSRLGARLAKLTRQLGETLAGDAALRGWIDERLVRAVPVLLARYRSRIGDYIAERVEQWESRELVAQLEQSVGKDLQYIRINGTLVGGLVGLALHGLTQWLAGA